MSNINSRNWSSWINLMPGSEHKIIVVGEVETNAGNLVPVLTEADPQGINPTILILNLTIDQQGDVGTSDVDYRDTRFEKPASAGQYVQVQILHDGKEVATMEVTEAH